MKKVTSAEELRLFAESRAASDMPREQFRSAFTDLLGGVADGLIAEHRFFELEGTRPPWLDTGMNCEPGDRFTIFVAGRIWMSRENDIWLGPQLWLWCRLGQAGPVFRGARCSNSFTADRDGPLYLGGAFPGEWISQSGDLASLDAYDFTEGGVTALVIRWNTDIAAGLRHLHARGDVGGFVACELDRLETDIVLPAEGWHYPWNVGTAEAFAVQDGFPAGTPIGCYTRDEVISYNAEVDMPFAPGTRIAWSWKMDKLPAKTREDFLHTHDYIAVAVYFENGKDLAYYWSAELPPETAYQCPIPKWTDLETHVVVRSGPDGLGEWFEEERDVYADYVRWIGDPPSRITGVWIIALSAFRHGEGQAEIANIRLISGEITRRIC